MLVLFVLLSPVSRNVALFALLSNLVQTSVLPKGSGLFEPHATMRAAYEPEGGRLRVLFGN